MGQKTFNIPDWYPDACRSFVTAAARLISRNRHLTIEDKTGLMISVALEAFLTYYPVEGAIESLNSAVKKLKIKKDMGYICEWCDGTHVVDVNADPQSPYIYSIICRGVRVPIRPEELSIFDHELKMKGD
jgi:hypothetical protein